MKTDSYYEPFCGDEKAKKKTVQSKESLWRTINRVYSKVRIQHTQVLHRGVQRGNT